MLKRNRNTRAKKAPSKRIKKTADITNDDFFHVGKRKKKGKRDEEILSSEEDEDLALDKEDECRDSDEEEKENLEAAETADEKRLRVAKAYLDKIKSLTEAHRDEDAEADENEEERRGKRDSLVSAILLQEQLEESGRVQRRLASRILEPSELQDWKILKRHKQSVTAICLSEDDSRGFSASKDGCIVHWDVETGKCNSYQWPSPSQGAKFQNVKGGKKQSRHVLAMAVSSDGRYLATSGLDRLVHLWDVRTQEHIQAFQGHRGAVSCLAFRQGTQQLISGSYDRTIKLWSAEDRSYIDTLYGHQSEILTIDCLRKERILSCGRDRTMRLWKVPEETQLVFRGHLASLECCCFVNNEEFLSGSDDGSIEYWSIQRKKPIFMVKNAHSHLNSETIQEDLKEEPDKETVNKDLEDAFMNGNGVINNGGSISPVESWVEAITVCRGSDLAASGAGNGLVRLWAIESSNKSLRPINDIPLVGFINSLAFAKSGRFLIAGVGQEPRLGRWGCIRKARNGVALYSLELNNENMEAK
eukprot:TRINITY_DN2012_c0_g1_i1.p1 TRINITY_DN2012_c0_g1~~TRINITY_DN2012_c0_g1_i1.p1  ORF type:complete len:530 (+),score=109.46 TRINITY_DN2012_c0_g1_i1:133-1722(+)